MVGLVSVVLSMRFYFILIRSFGGLPPRILILYVSIGSTFLESD
jgi:hypothetical protein